MMSFTTTYAHEDDGEVLVREWQEQERKKLRQPRIVVRRKVQQG